MLILTFSIIEWNKTISRNVIIFSSENQSKHLYLKKELKD